MPAVKKLIDFPSRSEITIHGTIICNGPYLARYIKLHEQLKSIFAEYPDVAVDIDIKKALKWRSNNDSKEKEINPKTNNQNSPPPGRGTDKISPDK